MYPSTYVFLIAWLFFEVLFSILLSKRKLEIEFGLFDLFIVALPMIALIGAYCSTIPDKSWFQILIANFNIIVVLPVSAIFSFLPLVIVNLFAEHRAKKREKAKQEKMKVEEQEAERRRLERIEEDEKRSKQLQAEIQSINTKYRISILPFLSQLSQIQCDKASSDTDGKFHSLCYNDLRFFTVGMNSHIAELNSEAESLALSDRAKQIDLDS